ncbi:MAG: hypothetical protein JO250_20290 [Armatimonadetes bacterium]|nr:hypothetical protein [Armatimonadota bacterium]
MPALLRENWQYKMLALAFAVLLHYYVINQQNPARLLTVPLAVRNVPSDALLGPGAPTQVTLTLNGPADELDRVALADVTASVDLSRARPGKSLTLPVQVKAPDDLQAAANPNSVTLDLAPRQTRRMAVTAGDTGPPLPGYRFLPPRVTPRLVTVAGSPDDVASVARLVARVDASAVGTVDDDFDIVALDVQGRAVPNVTLSPPRAHVTIRMVRAPALKNVLVSANVTGALPPSSRVDSIWIHPLTLVVAGRPGRLAEISTVSTAPIDVSGATSDVTRTVNCVAPPGVVFSGASAVVVTVHIVAQNAPAPAPATSPPASGTPPGVLGH